MRPGEVWAQVSHNTKRTEGGDKKGKAKRHFNGRLTGQVNEPKYAIGRLEGEKSHFQEARSQRIFALVGRVTGKARVLR